MKMKGLPMLSKSDYRYFEKARQIANVSDFSKTHVGCVAVYQGNIIGIACNTNKTHPNQDYYNQFREFHNRKGCVGIPKLHAEINCINQIKHSNYNFSKVKLYIYRIRKDQPFGIARPCPSCMAAIRDLGIKHIYYTTNDGYGYERLDIEKRGVA